MKSFTIVALTPKGELALLVQNKKRNDLNFLEKKTFNLLFLVEHLQNPAGIKFVVRSSALHLVSLVNPSALVQEITNSLLEEGAVKNVDFKVYLED